MTQIKVHLRSLGCPKNLADSEALLRELSGCGVRHETDPAEADVLMVNTCGFIEEAKRESIDEILGLLSVRREGQRVVVFGCMAKRYGAQLGKEIPELDAVFGLSGDEGLREYFRKLADNVSGGVISQAAAHPVLSAHYAPLKVAEGCSRHCTFCAIPGIRGRFTSRSPEEVMAEARRYVSAGVKEILLVAQDLTDYGFKGYGLPELIHDIASIEGDFWLRPLYFYPTRVDERLIHAIADNARVVKYVDMPVQHASERVLRAMGRAGTPAGYLKTLQAIRRAMPEAAIRSTVIVGFPGETDEDFRRLVDFAEQAAFENLGVFQYSAEEGTPAASLPGAVDPEVMEDRASELMEAQADISLELNQRFIGRRMRVLIDEAAPNSEAGGACYGRTYRQAPEIDGVTVVNGCSAGPGEFVEITVTAASEYDIEGAAA